MFNTPKLNGHTRLPEGFLYEHDYPLVPSNYVFGRPSCICMALRLTLILGFLD